nr:hypothetical protein [Limnospira maxima]
MIRKSSPGKFLISSSSKYLLEVFPATANIILAVSSSAAFQLPDFNNLSSSVYKKPEEDTMVVSATASVIDWS